MTDDSARLSFNSQFSRVVNDLRAIQALQMESEGRLKQERRTSRSG
jgi:hypothetical protein